MNQFRFLPVLCSLILVSLLAAPAIAATVTCPDTCSCLLPAEAAKAGLSAYCSEKKTVCGSDAQKNDKYCYAKATAVRTTQTSAAPPPQLVAVKPVTTTPTTKPTTVAASSFGVSGTRLVPATCPPTCVCAPEEKAALATAPLTLCGGTKTYCGSTSAGVPQYCYTLPVTADTTTAQPACAAGCTCTSDEKAAAAGLSLCGGKKTACDKDGSGGLLYCYSTSGTRSLVPSTPAVPETSLPSGRVEQGSSCAAGCACLLPRDADAKGLKYCNGKQTSCSASALATGAGSTETRYCYSMAAGSTSPVPVLIPAVMITTPIPAPQDCPSASSCLDEKTIQEKGYPYTDGNRTPCGYSKAAGVMYCAQAGTAAAGSSRSSPSAAAPAQGNSIFSAVGSFFASLLGGQQAGATVAGNEVQWSYCRELFGLEPCHGTCVNFTNDVENCGSCGHWCLPGEQCSQGRCVNLYRDPANCGGFGNVCPVGAPCVEGYCSALGCMDSTLTDCGNTCVDLRTSEANCGSCGNACSPSQICNAGACTSCADAGAWYCAVPGWGSTECTFVSTDRSNCGSCQHECGDDQVCSGGTCTACSEGTVRCGTRCSDLSSSPVDCGRCNNACNGPGQSCSGGVCGCPEGLYQCDNRCVDLRTATSDCGRCGRSCYGADQSCSNGMCLCSNTALTACGSRCIDTTSDRLNCGSCFNVCPTGVSCVEGECLCPGSAMGARACDGACVNTKTDEDNCGSCGHRCLGTAPSCVDGYCR